jgi:hypothetical protein
MEQVLERKNCGQRGREEEEEGYVLYWTEPKKSFSRRKRKANDFFVLFKVDRYA